MARIEFKSLFADELTAYLRHREVNGLDNSGANAQMKRLDHFLATHCKDKRFTKEHADKWQNRLPEESPGGHYIRINFSKRFFLYLFPQGYDIFLFDDVRNPPKMFSAHIYSSDEIRRYFSAVDTYDSGMNLYHKVQFPILFRLLYCCGTRITETLMIRKKDVDLEEGIILLSETKNKKERYVVLSEGLLDLMRQFADKTFYRLHDEDYIFQNYKGKRLRSDPVYEAHRMILVKAGIPYRGNGEGPRIHDWRHTFAVNAFKRMADFGMDMYVALPILSTYLGHSTIMATERYLKLTLELFPEIRDKMEQSMDEVFGEAVHA
jgi:integrase/recombinase XerD